MLTFIKVVFGIGICFVLFFQITENEFISLFSGDNIKQPLLLISCLLIMPLNWFLEALKWKSVLKPIVRLSLYESFKSIMSGVFIGIFTPARIGEYAGRLINLPENARIPSLGATFYNSIVQNGIHVVLGFGLSYYFIKNSLLETTEKMLLFTIIVSCVFVCFVVITFLPKYWQPVFQKLTRYKFTKWAHHFEYLKLIDTKTASYILIISMMRYFIYFGQYILILKSLGVKIPFIDLSSGVSAIYLIQSGIPLPPLLNILGRSEISVVVWNYFGISAHIALLATFILWFINLIIPAITGYIIFLKFKPA
ncbi:MAG: flippase-like domain-containing protein [Saprospiraceae bacterium]|nr:flippase-like domain-containing protein [Saprospiraceae bacterium]